MLSYVFIDFHTNGGRQWSAVAPLDFHWFEFFLKQCCPGECLIALSSFFLSDTTLVRLISWNTIDLSFNDRLETSRAPIELSLC